MIVTKVSRSCVIYFTPPNGDQRRACPASCAVIRVLVTITDTLDVIPAELSQRWKQHVLEGEKARFAGPGDGHMYDLGGRTWPACPWTLRTYRKSRC
ncbi:unnamed protein product [Mycena citricolor]|uniref:Uncharacterized protein n=1 Tax=Mycena citricolor TaxID=2018698 RepID=A0AAD2H255_9AGAR|nr:unnamed protein product [Mycena citricolor]